MNRKKILILACFFPPEGGAGAQRPFKFAKYLPDLGWDVTVVSREISENSGDKKLFPVDESLNDLPQHPGQCKVYRVSPAKSYRRFLRIDRYEEWSLAVGDKVIEILSKDNFNCILMTMSPFSLVRIIPLIRANSDVPIVLDFRDPWVFDGWLKHKTYLHWLYYRKMMDSAVRNSNGLIANTPEVGKLFKQHFTWLDTNQLTVIENGYDEEDFSFHPKHAGSLDDSFLIVYAGRLLTELALPKPGIKNALRRQLSYSPEPIDYTGRTLIHLIKALQIIQENNRKLFNKINIKCLGYVSETDIECVNSAGLDGKIELCGHLPHSDSVKEIQKADALFLPLHGLASGNRSRIVPGKTYEYLATGNTIIGCLPEGDARDLVLNSENSVIANPTDPDSIVQALIEAEKLYRKNKAKQFPLPWVKRYERKMLTSRLDDFLSKIVRGKI